MQKMANVKNCWMCFLNKKNPIMDYLIPDFDREVKARVGVMARCVRRSLYKPEDGSSISSIYAKVEGEKGLCGDVL